ncbi:MAG: polyprenyl synthetase family protein, partial [Candidatus Cloacimonetes bacterium]|nr:polyprenyl synthetase family protein [Candidatus Cloacimonadota bacterium]
FQIVDDLLDIEGSQEELGKSIGKDAGMEKATFPSVYGVEESRDKAAELTEKARHVIAPLGNKALKLDILAEHLLTRTS